MKITDYLPSPLIAVELILIIAAACLIAVGTIQLPKGESMVAPVSTSQGKFTLGLALAFFSLWFATMKAENKLKELEKDTQ